MNTRLIPAVQWRESLPVLRASNLAVIPTDTVYGIAALPLDAVGIERVYIAKGRPLEKAIPILVAGLEDAERVAVLTEACRRLCSAFWPGALTVIASASGTFASPAVAADRTVALRMPALPVALDIIEAAGGTLAVTSANLSGQPPARSAEEALLQLEGRVELIVDGGPSPEGQPSTIVRATGERIEILREGAITFSALTPFLSP